MIEHNASGSARILIILIGLLVSVALAIGVVWSTYFNRIDDRAPRPQVTARLKVPKPPETMKVKVPQPPPQAQRPQAPAGPVAPQPATAAESPTAGAQETLTPASYEPPIPAPPQAREETAAGSSGGQADTDTPIESTHESASDSASPRSAEAAAARDDTTADITPIEDQQPPAATTAAMDQKQPEPVKAQAPDDAAADNGENAVPASEADQAGAASSAAFNLQVGAYRTPAYAREAEAKLSEKGYAAFIVEITDARQRTWYMVRFGRFQDRKEAAMSRDRFVTKEKITAVITKAGQL